jgi:hypothetical protein
MTNPLKEDYAEACERLTAWWRGEPIAGHPLVVTAPRDVPAWPVAEPAPPADITARWVDPAHRMAAAEHGLAHTFFCGEALPYVETHLGPGSLAFALGSKPCFAETTVWFEPWIDDPDSVDALEFHEDAPAWRAQVRLVEAAVERAAGRYVVALPDLIEGLDVLASLRGSEPLVCDLVDRPDWVLARQRELVDCYFRGYDPLYDLTKDADGASQFAAFRVWAPGRTAKLQCDMSAMIGPGMFREFVAPFLERQCERLDYTFYHLDGPDAVRHLDALLEIGPLDGIQWTPGAGNPSPGDPVWYPLWKRVLEAGKRAFAIGVAPGEVSGMVKVLGTERLIMATRAESEGEAKRLVAASRRHL